MPRILYIDDDDANRLLVRRVLLSEGFEFLEADNARDGIDLALDSRPDVILMDIMLPEMDGLTATNQIRNIHEIAHTIVIALTANAMPGDRENILDAGCDGYISKPINIDTFVDEIMQFL